MEPRTIAKGARKSGKGKGGLCPPYATMPTASQHNSETAHVGHL